MASVPSCREVKATSAKKQSFRFGIIGGGWYGCHIATSLRALGFPVKIYEQHERLLHEASGNNQFRLHMGFHYARHSETRTQSHDGFQRFLERYPNLSRSVRNNIYAVPVCDSLIDYGTYRTIMASSGIHFTEGTPQGVDLTNVAGTIYTDERVLLLSKARAYFYAELKDVLALGHRVSQVQHMEGGVSVDGELYDFVIDATWGHYTRPVDVKVIYEPTLLLYYEGPPDFPAVTLVDGPLCSVYPTEEPGLFTLSSVPHTPLGQFDTPSDARAARDSTSPQMVDRKRALMEEQVKLYLPAFSSLFQYVGPQLAIKTKLIGANDDRTCQVMRRGRIFSVMSGKIDTVFFATERILSMIEGSQALSVDDITSSLREDIMVVQDQTKRRAVDARL